MPVAVPSSKAPLRRTRGKPNDIDISVGAEVRRRRVMLGMSQEKLADALGVTFQQIQKYERGANRIGAGRLYELAQALGCGIGELFPTAGAEAVAALPADKHVLAFVRAYARVPEHQRAAVLSMLKAMAGSDEGSADEPGGIS